jgi:FHA domain/Protein kinase domain
LHEQGVVGLDLRPPLITVDTAEITDRVQIDDIGLRSLLKTLGDVGSQQVNDIDYLDPRYAPPEYINNGSIGPWSDVYQLGLLTFELVTGRLPFVGRTTAETAVMQTSRPLPQMSLYKHDAPASLQAVLERALAKNLNDRFANAGQFLSALETVQLQPVSTPGLTREMAPVKEDDAAMEKPSQDAAQENREEALAPEEGVYAYLCYEKDGQEIQRFAIREKKVLVGRTDRKHKIFPQIDLTVHDPDMTVSRRHALIRYKDSFFYLKDLRSHNGTMLGKLKLNPVQEEMLQHDDVVQFGSVRMVFKIPGKPSRPGLKMDKDES